MNITEAANIVYGRVPTGLQEDQPVPHGTVYMSGTFLTRDDAEDAIRRYITEWHPMGYGTCFEPIRVVKGYFIVRGVRAGSCD